MMQCFISHLGQNQEFETNGQSRQPTSLESAVSLKLRMIGHCIMVRFQGMDTYRN